jgi:hypothetical protein
MRLSTCIRCRIQYEPTISYVMYIRHRISLSSEPHFLSSCLGVSTRVLMFIKIQRQALYNFKIQLTCSNLPPTCSKSEVTSRRLAGFEHGCLICEFPKFCKISQSWESIPCCPGQNLTLYHCTSHAFLHLSPGKFCKYI